MLYSTTRDAVTRDLPSKNSLRRMTRCRIALPDEFINLPSHISRYPLTSGLEEYQVPIMVATLIGAIYRKHARLANTEPAAVREQFPKILERPA